MPIKPFSKERQCGRPKPKKKRRAHNSTLAAGKSLRSNPERRADLRRDQFGDEETHALYHALPCFWHCPESYATPLAMLRTVERWREYVGHFRQSDPCHIRTRGAGGLQDAILPGHRRCHAKHSSPKSGPADIAVADAERERLLGVAKMLADVIALEPPRFDYAKDTFLSYPSLSMFVEDLPRLLANLERQCIEQPTFAPHTRMVIAEIGEWRDSLPWEI